MGEDTGVTPSGPGCQPTASAAAASSQSGIPNAETIAALLTEAQQRAMLLMPHRLNHYVPARFAGGSGAVLMSLNDLWRGKRGLAPPIMLTTWLRDEWSGARRWTLTDLGREVQATLEASAIEAQP